MKCAGNKDLVAVVAGVIARESLIVSGEGSVIVGLSGGADSVALFDVLVRLGWDVVPVHCNFHLRGAESERDREVACRVAAHAGHECRVVDFDVAERCRATGESVEMACRRLRYDFFERLRREIGAQAIAVAHHGDDNVETMMLNLLRGSGLSGARGMRWRNGHVIRPLLGVRRADILAYVEDRGLEWITDSSNLENDFARNRLRNIVLPELERCFPGAVDRLMSSLAYLAEDDGFFHRQVVGVLSQYDDRGVLRVAQLVAERPDDARLLTGEWIARRGFSRKIAGDVVRSVSESGRVFRSDDVTLLLDRGVLRELSCDVNVDIVPHVVRLDEPPFSMSVSDVGEFEPDADRLVASFDATILDGEPVFELRPWRRGDRFRPFGMTGSKKLSDLFRDLKVADDLKAGVPVLTRDGIIVWVVGLRQSADFAVTPDSKSFVRLVWHV